MEAEVGSSSGSGAARRRRRPSVTSAISELPAHEHDGVVQLAKPENWILDLLSAFSSLLPGSTRVHRYALRRLAFGMMGTVYVGVLLVVIMAVALGIGMGLVWLWLEEPVLLRQPLHFDYTDAHPRGLVSLSSGPAGTILKKRPIPVGHTFRVALVLVLPESTFNLRLGVFQVVAETISSDGDVLANSTRPCMLVFRSLPVRIMRALLMGLPHVFGTSCETQKIILRLVEYKEKNTRTEAVKVTLKPRAGTSDIPQIYSSEIVINSRLPRGKDLAYNWKWTFYVWVSLYVYMMLITALLCCFKPLIFPRRLSDRRGADTSDEEALTLTSLRDDGELSDELPPGAKTRADRLHRKGKVPVMPRRLSPIPVEGSSSNVDDCKAFEVIEDEDFGASSESSVCPRG